MWIVDCGHFFNSNIFIYKSLLGFPNVASIILFYGAIKMKNKRFAFIDCVNVINADPQSFELQKKKELPVSIKKYPLSWKWVFYLMDTRDN